MKKLVILLMFMSLLSLASAAEIQLSKNIYAPKETLQAEIIGNFIEPINVEQVYFYRDRNIPVIYDILKTENKYLLYALLPYKEGNYTLKIKDIRYEGLSGTSSGDLEQEFKIQKSNTTTFSVNPGFVVAREDFYIKVEATGSINIEAELEATEEKQTISLSPYIEKKVFFSISNITEYTETNLKIQEYNIPVFIFPEATENQTQISEAPNFRFNPSQINATILEESFFQVSLLNFGNTNITNINLAKNISEDLEITISPENIESLEEGTEKIINISIKPNKEGGYGRIIANAENLSTELLLDIKITENKSEVNYTGPTYAERCSDIGQVCQVSERCDGVSVFVGDEYCCKGKCISEENGDNTWIYGVILLIVVVMGLIVLSVFMRKKQKQKLDVIKKRSQDYKERMSADSEVKGNLSRV